MFSRTTVASAVLPFFVFACASAAEPAPTPEGQKQTTPVATNETPAPEQPAAEPYELFGAELTGAPEVAFEDLIAKPKDYAGKRVVTSGVVRQSCLKRGCWMDVRPESDRSSTASITVRFRNYKFFVPLNSRGARVKMDGILKVRTMTAEEVLHMEEEGATITNKNPDGTAETAEFTAFGVEMRGRQQQ